MEGGITKITYQELDPCAVSTICIAADTGSLGEAQISAECILHPENMI